MISFKANFVNNTNVKCLNRNGNYKNIPVQFVELDIDSDLDMETLTKVKENWISEDDYAKKICDDFKDYHDKIKINEAEKFYALTNQYGSCTNLDPAKILGVTQVYKDFENSLEIVYLQTNPKYKYGTEKREIKHIGKAIIESIKNNFKNNEIFLFTTDAGRPLYQKLGFKSVRDTVVMALKR